MADTRGALLKHGALLYARHGVGGVSAKELHDAAGAKNESALHYHFRSQRGLVAEIIKQHLEAVERRRQVIVDALDASTQEPDIRQLVFALAAPMASDLADPVGRAHLRIIGEVNHPALGYESPFPTGETVAATAAPAGRRVILWLWTALGELPEPIRAERVAALRTQLIDMFAARARLIDDDDTMCTSSLNTLFVQNMIDMIVAGLVVEPSATTLDRLDAVRDAGAPLPVVVDAGPAAK